MEQTTRRFKAIWIKTLVCMLCFALIFTASPVFTIAETNDVSLIPDVEEKAAEIMYEVVDDRTANQKVFRMDDGSYMTAQYEYDIHYEDNDGWENIDNTLIESAAADSADFAGVEAENGKRAVKFANNTSSGKVLRIKNGNAKIVWTVPNANKSTGQFEQPEPSKESADSNDKYLRLNKSVSQATYPDVWNNVDLRYTVMGSSIKEEIIIKKALDGYAFEFELELKKSSLVQNADGSLTIADTDGNRLYTIPAPFMSDASGRYSEAVEYEVTVISEKNNKATYRIRVVADKDWINSDDTVFPVVVDPTVTMHKSSMFSINDYSVSSASPNHTDNSDALYIGNSADKGICRTYIEFNNIEIPKKPADKLVGLYLRLTTYTKPDDDGNHIIDSPNAGAIEMYECTNWVNNPTWNNQPNVATEMLEFTYCDTQTQGGCYLDITELYDEWRFEEVHGIMLKSHYESQSGMFKFMAETEDTIISPVHPTLIYVTKNFIGLEDYWSTHSQSVGESGVGYVSDYTRGLTYAYNDFSIGGEYASMGVTHYYNSTYHNMQYTGAIGQHGLIDTTPPLPVYSANYGNGWHLNAQQSVVLMTTAVQFSPQDAPVFYQKYVYVDADGTYHWFNSNSSDDIYGEFIDEDGLGLTLTVDDTAEYEYIIKDKDNNRLLFNRNGTLAKMVDRNNNATTYTYDSAGKLTSITDASGRSVTLSYNGTNLTSLTDTAGRVTAYQYSIEYNSTAYSSTGNYLRKIIRPDGSYTEFSYDVDGDLSCIYDSASNYSIEYGCVDGEVIRYCEKSGNQVGKEIRVSEAVYSTIYSENGEDNVYGTNDDIHTFYNFDRYGRTTSTYTEAEGTVYSAACEYTNGIADSVNAPGDVRKVNKIKTDTMTGGTSFNLLTNGSFERDLYGWNASLGSNCVGELGNISYFGTQSLKIGSSGTTAVTGKYDHTAVTLPAGKYTLSAYVKTVDFESTTSSCGAYIELGSNRSAYVSSTTRSQINNGWKRLTVSLTLSAQTTVFATVGISSSKGTAYFDGIQLETNSYGDYNLLENGTFDEKSSNVAYGWIDDGYNNTENYTIVSSHSDRNNVLRLNGSPTLPSYVSYSVNNIESYSSYCYIVSGWAKANSSNGFNGNGCAFAIDVVLKYTDNTDDTFRFSFNPVYTGWQNITGIAVPKQGKTVSQVYVYLIYDCNINSCYFDDICLTRGEASCYTYDENGNVSKVVSNSKNTTTMSYSGNNITAVTDEDGTSTYTYDSNNNVKTATSIGGLTTNYNYNTNGTLSNANATDGNQTIYKSYGYNQNGNYITSVTDAYGGTTTSVYDENKGLLTSTTDSMELTTSYTYNNSNDLLTSVMAGSGSSARTVSYNYNNKKQLSSITHNGFNYNFTYDNWGNTNSIKIGTRQLSSSYYHDIHGYLVNFHYGNGWQKYNTYDSLGRVTRNVCVNNDQGYFYSESTYGYNKLGQLTEFYDSLSEVTSTYDYDSVGRLVTTYTSDGSLDTHYSYDSQGRIYSKRYAGHSGLIKSQSIGYNSDGYVRNFTDTATYSFSDIDKFGRVTQNHIINTTSGNTIYTNSYSYRSGSGGANATTTWVSNENTSGFGNFGYSYMPNGNIYWMTATRNGTSYDVLYEYDGLGQLTTEANNYTNQTVYYTYDAGGNITSKRTYTGVWETMIEDSLVTDTYTYGNSEWKDLLTAYNGQTITYDTIGNPLTYRRGETMTWDAGRTLDKIDFDNYGDLLFFDYDTQGMRLRKYGPRVDDYNNTYEADLNYIDYYYDGDTLIYERRSNNGDNVSELFTIEYVYGVNGITGFRIHQGNTTTDYYYVKNIMGDVLGIVNASGTLVAEYRYDAYGNPVMILDGNGNDVSTNYAHIANINPIRYRGYYYDIESGFYYLNSRYYDPEIGRFISPDTTDILTATPMAFTDKNLYAYCDNNPVTRADDGGEFWHIVAGGVVGGILSAVATAITGGSVEEVIVSAIYGAASGALTAALPGAGLLIDVGFGFLEEMTVSAIESKDVKESVGNATISVGVDSVSNLMGDGTRSTKETLKEFSKAKPKTLKGNHPKVKASAKQIVRRTSKTMGREIGETVTSKTIGNFFKNILKAIF